MKCAEVPLIVPGTNPRLSRQDLSDGEMGFDLLGQRCEDCGNSLFLKTGVCPACRSTPLGDQRMPQQGSLPMPRLGELKVPMHLEWDESFNVTRLPFLAEGWAS